MPRDALFRIETLGSGQFGQVDKMATSYFSASGTFGFVAVKTLLEADDVDGAGDTAETLAERAQHKADFENEIETMKELNHPHLVTMLGCCVNNEPLLMILEFSCGGSLEDWLPENGPGLRLPDTLSILHQVAMGLQSLKENRIIHRCVPDSFPRSLAPSLHPRLAPLLCSVVWAGTSW